MTACTPNRVATVVLALSLFMPQAQAQEKPGNDFVPASGLGNWTHDYDVSGFKPGTYNILARAVDSAGNVTFATPFNLIVDPASDLPVVRIVNPLPQARVGADLNIVGTCIDDDAVGYVEIRLDGGEWQRARGSDFWSHYLPTSGVADGPHELSARGVDRNGLAGLESTVSFNLDRTKPLHTIARPSFGAIVSKRISIQGSVFDANGLASVAWSADSGSTWQALKYSYDKKAATASFGVAVDTNKLPDGPAVLWLRSVDRVGSESVAVFLYFVDNTKAELAVLSPGEGEAVNGRFSMTGRVYDTVGVASLEWSRDKETGRIELVPGNPYFSIPVEAPAKAGGLTIRLNATDVAGNVSTLAVTRQVDPGADLPTVALAYPASGAAVDGSLFAAGGARDDDGVASVAWRVDEGPETVMETAGSFSFRADGLASGAHELWVRATDVNGLPGLWVRNPFTFSGKAPVVSLLGATDASGERDFRPGVSVSTMDGKAAISGIIVAANPLVDLSYTVNGGAAVKLAFGKTGNGANFTIPLSASLPWGVLDLAVRAVDSSGKSGTARAPVLAVDWSRPRVGPLLDFGMARATGQGSPAIVAVSDAAPLSGTFVTPFDGEGIASVRLEPASAIIAASFEGATVKITRKGEGATAPTSVVVTTVRGHSFGSGPYVFTTDTASPSISISEPAFGSWLRGTVSMVAEAADGDQVSSVEYSANGGPWNPLVKAGREYRASFDSSALDGPVRLDVRAADPAGNTATASTAFMADGQPPRPARLLPRDGDSVAGPTLFVMETGEGAQSLAGVELGRAGVFKPLDPGAVVSFIADPAAGPLVLKVTDKAGNKAELDPLAGLAVAQAARSAPAELSSIKSNAGAVPAGFEGPALAFSGADAVGPLSWTSPFREGPASDGSAFPDWAGKAVRASGALSLNATFTGVTPDPKKPLASWGWAPDATNQALALKPDKAGGWTAAIKAPARPDGPAMLWVRIQDSGRGELLSRMALDFDSTPAAIELVSPVPAGAKASSAGPFTLVVRATDSSGIASLSYEAGAERGDFETGPGSGDSVKAFSFPPKAVSLSITVRAVDGSGNRSSSNFIVAYDIAADTPAVSFIVPADGAAVASLGDGATATAMLYASDDDATASVAMTLDVAAFTAEGPGPLYAIDMGRPAPGRRAATATASDAAGLRSAKTAVSFAQAGAAPTVVMDEALQSAASGGPVQARAFVPGSALVADGKSALAATIAAPNGLSRVEFSFNGAAATTMAVPKPGADGRYALRITLPATLPWDRNSVSVTATDSTGAATTASTSLYRVAPLQPGARASAEGIYAYDSRLEDGKPTSLSPGDVLGALWHGRPIASVRLEPPRAFLAASFEGDALTITAVSDGGAEPGAPRIELVVETVDGDAFRSPAMALRVDSSAPELAILEPAPGAPVQAAFAIAGTAADPNGIAAVDWSTDGGSSWTPFEPGAAGFRGTVAPTAADGPIGILVRATDRAGIASVAQSSVSKDAAVPLFVFESPRPADTVNGTILVSGYVSDGGSVASVSFSPDGIAWEPLEASARGSAPVTQGGKGDAAPAAAPRLAAFSRIVDLGALPQGGAAMAFRAADSSGNAAVVLPLDPAGPAFAVDMAADRPSLQIQIPAEGEVARADFVVSGMAFDDDGVAELFWRLDGAAWTRLAGSNGFSVPFRLLDLADNEHVFEAYATDLNGVQGETAARAFKVSREEPVGKLESPDVEFTNKGVVELRGVASDANDVAEVAISFDNGATYNNAVGTTQWSYRVDSKTLPDGVHSVYIKLLDGYGTPGFAAGLLSVDNSPPVIRLDSPSDGDEGIGAISVGGRVSDGLAVQKLSLEISRIGSPGPAMLLDLPTNGAFSSAVDIKTLEPGWYNVKAIALDRAGNDSYDSRNIVVLEAAKADYAELVFPAHGERLSGHFTIDGRVVSSEPVKRAAITLGGAPFAVVETKAGGWFSLAVATDSIADGDLTFGVEAVSASGAKIASEPRTISWTRDGPWVDIDALVSGDFVIGRPYLSGQAGWDTPEPAEAGKEAAAAYKALVAGRRVARVELSRDNGKTWSEASGGKAFKFRLETQEYPNGILRLLAKATFANGETAVRKRLVVLDTKAPTVAILRPSDNGRYNGVISIEGSAADENGLAEVAVVVRSGDKASYEVPGFIQGSYLDVHLLGATRFEAGLGLSFFDDNVKLQIELGQGFDAQPSWDNLFGVATADTPAGELSRFGGYVLGARLLANLAYLPFSYWFGPDWDFFSMSFAVGASFTYFSQMDDIGSIFSPPDGKYMVLSGVVGQWEFAKFDFGWSVLKSLGFYLEGGLVFIPSEASTSLEEFIRPNIGFGLRVGLF